MSKKCPDGMWYPLIDSVNMVCRKTQINPAQDLFHTLYPEVTIFKQKFPFFSTVLCSVLFRFLDKIFIIIYRFTFLWNSVALLEFITNGLSIYSRNRLVATPINFKMDCMLRCNIHKLFQPSAAKVREGLAYV